MQFTLPVNALGFTMTESGPMESIGLLIFTSLEQKMNTAMFVKVTVKLEGNINLFFFLTPLQVSTQCYKFLLQIYFLQLNSFHIYFETTITVLYQNSKFHGTDTNLVQACTLYTNLNKAMKCQRSARSFWGFAPKMFPACRTSGDKPLQGYRATAAAPSWLILRPCSVFCYCFGTRESLSTFFLSFSPFKK